MLSCNVVGFENRPKYIVVLDMKSGFYTPQYERFVDKDNIGRGVLSLSVPPIFYLVYDL